jgi:hypothetical protein
MLVKLSFTEDRNNYLYLMLREVSIDMAKDSLQIVIVDDVKAVANSLRRELRFIARKNEILF